MHCKTTASVEITYWESERLAEDTQQEEEDENLHGSAGHGSRRMTGQTFSRQSDQFIAA